MEALHAQVLGIRITAVFGTTSTFFMGHEGVQLTSTYETKPPVPPFFVLGWLGFEPRTVRLKAEYSTFELAAQPAILPPEQKR